MPEVVRWRLQIDQGYARVVRLASVGNAGCRLQLAHQTIFNCHGPLNVRGGRSFTVERSLSFLAGPRSRGTFLKHGVKKVPIYLVEPHKSGSTKNCLGSLY